MIVSDAQVLTHFIDTKVLVTLSCPTFEILWNVAHQAPLSIGSSRQEFWSGSPCSPLGDLPDLGIKPASPVLQEDSLLSEPSNGRSYYNYLMIMIPQTYWHLRIENINHLVTSTLTNQRTVTLLSHLAFKNALLRGEESRWRRNRTGRSLSLLQIHRKNNRTVNKVYKTTSDH